MAFPGAVFTGLGCPKFSANAAVEPLHSPKSRVCRVEVARKAHKQCISIFALCELWRMGVHSPGLTDTLDLDSADSLFS
jgi:hypothetical protein